MQPPKGLRIASPAAGRARRSWLSGMVFLLYALSQPRLRQYKQWEAVMDSTVTLIVTRGPLSGRKFVFADATTCLIGRSRDCTITLSQEVGHLDVSRRHCLLEIEPPAVRICDLGSLNGTFVNGKKIGQRGTPEATPYGEAGRQRAMVLIDGDEIRLGEHTAFRVCIYTGERENAARKTRSSSGELQFEATILM